MIKKLIFIIITMTKALVMFSGGLDSLLAIKILEKQGIDCTALTFTTPFFGKDKAEKQAEKFGIKLKTVDITDSHFEVLKNPKYGYGRFLNPCIDCHGFMFKIAGEIADERGYDIIASGEVLGQRPMSQNKKALNSVRKLAGRDILRPMSAKLLESTIYEKKGLVDRKMLLDIEGRGRLRQITLAQQLGLNDFEVPGGGCLLTEIGYTDKLKKLFKAFPKHILPIDAELIKYGRLEIFERGFIVMSRDDKSNHKLISLNPKNKKEYQSIILDGITGPISIIKIINNLGNIKSDLIYYYKLKVNKLKDQSNIIFKNI